MVAVRQAAIGDDDPYPAIPDELKRRAQWVTWRLEKLPKPTKDGKTHTKVPHNPRGGYKAKANDAKTWAAYVEACAGVARGAFDGAGYELTHPHTGIDLDGCRDPGTGEIAPWALAEVERFSSYTEVSPSGRGLHTIIRGTMADGDGHKSGPYEAYSARHFLTMTGDHLPGTPATIEDRQEALDAFCAEHFGPKAQADAKTPPRRTQRSTGASATPTADDSAVIERMCRFNPRAAALWHGDRAGYTSASEADEALIAHLDFNTLDGDRDQIARLFMQSGLYRPDEKHPHDPAGYVYLSVDAWQRDNPNAAHFGDRGAPSAKSAGAAPRDDAGDDRGEEPPEPEAEAAQEPSPGGYPLTDYGNAERLRDRHGRDMRYCYTWKAWLVWDGMRWQRDERGQVVLWAKETIRAILGEAEEEIDDKARKALVSHEQRSEAEARIRAMIALAESECAITPDQLDAPATEWLFNCASGTIDLHTGHLRAWCREDYITKLSPAEYDPAAAAARFDAFLARIMGGSAELIAFLQRAAGYTMTGSTREQVVFIPHGTGDNGKSTLLDAWRYVMGNYGEHVRPETLMVKKGDPIPQDIAKLKGARFVSAVETEEGQRLAESLIKQLSGDKAMTARFMRSNEFTFQPVGKVWLATNHRPEIRGTDHAIWRRIRLIPFTVAIPEHEKDLDLLAKLNAEAAGILAWMVRGCLAWQRDGLGTPEDVRQATDDYRRDMDSLGDFLAERTISDPRAWAKASDLYAAYTTWCAANGQLPIKQRTFGHNLTERGFKRDRGTANVHVWRGIGLRTSDPSDPSDPDSPMNAHETENRRSSPSEGHYGSLRSLNVNGHQSRDRVRTWAEVNGWPPLVYGPKGEKRITDHAAWERFIVGASADHLAEVAALIDELEEEEGEHA